MATPIIMPKFGQMTEECVIVEWYKKEGDKIAKGDVLFTIETDKSAMDVESFEDGTLLKIVVQPGISVPVQSTVGFLGTPGETISEEARSAAAASSESVKATAQPTPETPRHEPPAGVKGMAATTARQKISPRAAALAREFGIDTSQMVGSGPEGRVVEEDVRAYLGAKGSDRLQGSAGAETSASKEQSRGAPGTAGEFSDGIISQDARGAEADQPRPLSRMRQVIAQRLTKSFRDTPHFYVTVSVDMTDLVAFRGQLKAAGEPYTITDFIAEAAILTLREFPEVNSSTDGTTIRRFVHVNLGVAVSLEQGLVVPVIRAAEQLSLVKLCHRLKEAVDRARAGKATPDDLSGGTFTISNMGMLDVENFGAIINPGESAILAVASIKPRPVVREGCVEVREVMMLTLSCDHRIVDGALGARFLNAVRQKLEDPDLWKRLTGPGT